MARTALLGPRRRLMDAFSQPWSCPARGETILCSIDGLRSAALQSPKCCLCSSAMSRLYTQAQQSAACFATHHVEARLSCWLRRARHLSLFLTQDYIAEMLGVKRTSVTLVAHTIQSAGPIKYGRGRIFNAEALHDGACECYETVKRHYARLLGANTN